MSEKQETTTDRDDPAGTEDEQHDAEASAGVAAETSAEVDAGAKRTADHEAEREAARQRLERQWRCRVLAAEDLPFDWHFIRNDTVAGIASYHQHPESGNVLIPAGRWHWLRMWSTAFLIPHFWVIDFFSQGLRYKMYPQHSGLRYETLAKDEQVYISISQNEFDILKEEAP